MAVSDAPAPVRIRRAALKLFAARGFEATGIREIAETAAIPTSLLYHYRRSKEEILRDLIVDGLSRHLESSRRALELARTPEEKVRVLVTVHVLVPIRNPEMARVMETEVRSLSASSQEIVRGKRIEGDERWEAVLREGVESGVFTVPDPHLARLLLLRMCTGIGSWYTPNHPLGVDELVGRLTDHALAFLRAKRAGKEVLGEAVSRPALGDIQALVDLAHRDDDSGQQPQRD